MAFGFLLNLFIRTRVRSLFEFHLHEFMVLDLFQIQPILRLLQQPEYQILDGGVEGSRKFGEGPLNLLELVGHVDSPPRSGVVEQLEKDHPQTPAIGLECLLLALEGFGRHVLHRARLHFGVLGVGGLARPPEIAYLEVHVIVQQDVLWLQIPHDVPLGVDVRQALDDLFQEGLYPALLQDDLILEILQQVAVGAVVQHDVQLPVLHEEVVEPDDVLVVEEAVAVELLLDVLDVGLVHLPDLDDFDGVKLLRYFVLGFVHLARNAQSDRVPVQLKALYCSELLTHSPRQVNFPHYLNLKVEL